MLADENNQNSNSGAKRFVRELQDRETFSSVFLTRDKTIAVGKNGKPFMSVVLSDNSGSVDARVWDNVEHVADLFQSGDLVRVKGAVQIFQGRKQVVVHKLERVEPADHDMNDFLSKSAQAPEEMFQKLLAFVDLMQNPSLKQLTLDVLQDPEIRPKLLIAPAAKTIHHAYLGGLLEHILSICGIMKGLATHYGNLNLDYLLFGAIFHDIGKVWELQIDQGISYTDKGKLIGHMVMAVELVEKKASRIFGFPDELKDLCKHIILSHHGRLEYGSPKTPAFLEAFIVAAVDDLDSKINTISQFIDGERGSGESWSRFNQMFERYFYLKS